MLKINRNQAEEIFNKQNVVDTKINQSQEEICLIFDFSNGAHLQMKYTYPNGEKTYFLLNEANSL
jgi:hypothetical protein